jgi:acyl-CoA dehydrogenase
MPDVTLEDFTAEVTAFLDANAEKKAPAKSTLAWGEGDDNVSMFEEVDREQELLDVKESQAWRAQRYDAGLGWITGPAEYGGRELSSAHERVYNGLEGGYKVPGSAPFTIGLGMVAPTIHAHCTQEVKDAYLAKLYRGDMIACQLFSEPGAGSDLASVQTKAVRDGDEWVLTGQKVWTSGAHYSDIGEIICRTDPDLPKHKGLTAFVIDMKDPAVEVRPLRQMTGGASFNEVFLTELRVPDSHRMGDVNGGWGVALTTLMNERASLGAGGGTGGQMLTRVRQLVEHLGLSDDPLVRDELMRVQVAFQVAKYTNQRALDKIKSGQLPGPEMSTAKLALTNNMWALAQFVARVLGPRITADTGEWGTYSWNGILLGIPGMRVAGGTDEIMKNIVAERVLGLPKEPGVDSKTPFKDLLVN